MTQVKVKLLHPAAQMPKAAHPGDAWDLYAIDDLQLMPGVPVAVRTGVAIELPEGYRAWITPRGSLALKSRLGILNAPGLIDNGYRGELKVAMINFHPLYAYPLHRGDRIAQLVIEQIPLAELVQVDEMSTDTSRGVGGFGSTGR